jgi:hypothetical protein
MIDANHAYDTTAALALGRLVERHNIHWFEEPVSPLDVDGYLELKHRLPIPLAGGECEFTRFGFEPWLRRRAIDYAQPDLCACGGITEGMKIATLASVYNVHVTPHAWGTAIGQAAALHFYAARPRHPSTLTKEDKLIECDMTSISGACRHSVRVPLRSLCWRRGTPNPGWRVSAPKTRTGSGLPANTPRCLARQPHGRPARAPSSRE